MAGRSAVAAQARGGHRARTLPSRGGTAPSLTSHTQFYKHDQMCTGNGSSTCALAQFAATDGR
jgi:hypothetical protein